MLGITSLNDTPHITMFDLLTLFVPLFAQDAPAGGAAPPAGGGGEMMLMIMLPALLLMFWFFMIRPQQKQEEKTRKMIDSLDRNDRVYTVGGMVGTIHSIDKEKNEVVLKVDDSNGTKIRFLLSAIAAPLPKNNDKTDKADK